MNSWFAAMDSWLNVTATVKILGFGLLVGALLPALFAVGLRVGATAAAEAPSAGARRPALVALSWAIFALVLTSIVIGVLFIARDFIGHHIGWYILGATPT
jgi:multisubunit Na+/H+ antiporter MnhC subunit